MKISILILQAALVSLALSSLYSVSSDFKVSYEVSINELAHATYEERIYEKGWNFLHLYANQRMGLVDQHRGAGFLEGYLEYKGIYSAYQNFCGKLLKGEEIYPKAQSFVDNQLEYLEKMILAHPRDIYWQYAEAYLEQLKYMYRGYLTRINIESSPSMYISFSNFYYLTNTGDLEDLLQAFSQPQQNGQQFQKKPGNCNGIVKLLEKELFIGHSTHNIYQFMIRTFKTYHFPTRNQNVGSQWFSFSSRPGDIVSKDDFYYLSSGLIVMESSFGNYNPNNYKDLNSNTVPCWLRQTIAANLAKNGEQWVDYFLKQRSGTHNNQWVVVDPEQLNTTQKNVVVFVEEAFSQYDVIDMTDRLKEKGFVATYNVPFSTTIYKKLGYQKYPYTYEEDPRAYEYAQYNAQIYSTDDMKKWLLQNSNTDPTVGIAPRYDLKAKNPTTFGLTDLKIVTPETLRGGYLWAYSGPSKNNGKFAPFDWTNWPSETSYGMPRKWDFNFQKYTMVESSQVQNIENKPTVLLQM